MYLEETGYQMSGRKVELIVEDSQGRPDAALSKLRKVVEQYRWVVRTRLDVRPALASLRRVRGEDAGLQEGRGDRLRLRVRLGRVGGAAR